MNRYFACTRISQSYCPCLYIRWGNTIIVMSGTSEKNIQTFFGDMGTSVLINNSPNTLPKVYYLHIAEGVDKIRHITKCYTCKNYVYSFNQSGCHMTAFMKCAGKYKFIERQV